MKEVYIQIKLKNIHDAAEAAIHSHKYESNMLAKLKHYGIRGIANVWFISYPFDKKQFVSINDYVSNQASVKYGVPLQTHFWTYENQQRPFFSREHSSPPKQMELP